MKKFIISENDEMQRLDKFIGKVFFNVPKSLLYKLIRTKNIRINKKKSAPNQMLKQGDLVYVFGLDDFFKDKNQNINLKDFDLNSSLDVVFEDENILVLNKHSKIMSQPNSKQKNSLIDLVIKYLIKKREYFPEKENTFVPAFCTRLDTNTKGLIIAGKNAKSLRCLNKLTKEGNIKKTYWCMVHGIMEKPHDFLVGYWTKNSKSNIVKITKNKRQFSKTVFTEYFLLKQNKNTAELKIFLHSGKSHQIRAHMKQINHPIVGDVKYGSFKKTDLKLTCVKLEFFCKSGYLQYLNGKTISLK